MMSRVTTLSGDALTDPHQILDPGQVAALLQIPESTLKVWRLAGKGPRHFRAGRHVRYRLSSVLAWVEEQEAAVTAQPPARPGAAAP